MISYYFGMFFCQNLPQCGGWLVLWFIKTNRTEFTWSTLTLKYWGKILLNLSFDGVFKTPIFICENNRKSNKIMHCVDLFLLSICYGSI